MRSNQSAPHEVICTIVGNALAGIHYSGQGLNNGTLAACLKYLGVLEARASWKKDRLVAAFHARVAELRVEVAPPWTEEELFAPFASM